MAANHVDGDCNTNSSDKEIVMITHLGRASEATRGNEPGPQSEPFLPQIGKILRNCLVAF